MNLEDIVGLGDRIDLEEIKDDDLNEDEQKFYITKVYDVNEDDQIEVLMPMEKLKTVLLPQDARYQLYVYSKRGIYTCEVTVAERYKTDTVIVAVLDLDTELKKRQRREFYRYDCIIGMNTRALTKQEEEYYLEKRNTRTFPEPQDKSVATDISGGGLRFISAAKYEDGCLINCRFIISVKDEPKTYDVVMRLIAKVPASNNKNNTEYRGQFVYIGNNDREDIIKYIFDEERRLRQRK